MGKCFICAKVSKAYHQFIIFTLLFCLSAAMLGLTSQQIHRHGGQNTFDYPGKEYGHTIGLLLFTSIFCLLIALFHWALSVKFYIVLFFVSPQCHLLSKAYGSDHGHLQRCRSWYLGANTIRPEPALPEPHLFVPRELPALHQRLFSSHGHLCSFLGHL